MPETTSQATLGLPAAKLPEGSYRSTFTDLIAMEHPANETCKQHVLNRLAQLGYLSPDCRQEILISLKLIRKPKWSHLAIPGHGAGKCWFICEGLLKAYYLSRMNKQRVIAFFNSEDLVLDTYLFFHEKSYPYYITTLEDSIIAELSFAEAQNLSARFPELHKICLKLSGIANRKSVLRNRILHKEEATLCYKAFCKWFPFHEKISREDIAAYLNISKSRLNHIILKVRAEEK